VATDGLHPTGSSFRYFTTDEVGEQPEPVEADLAAARIDDAPVRDGQLRAPRRWERLLVEAAVIGGRDRWRRRRLLR